MVTKRPPQSNVTIKAVPRRYRRQTDSRHGVRIINPDSDGIAGLGPQQNSNAGYLTRARAYRETIGDGWLMTGDLGSFDFSGHLTTLRQPEKTWIVTEEGKNIYPKILKLLRAPARKEFCVFTAEHIWCSAPWSARN